MKERPTWKLKIRVKTTISIINYNKPFEFFQKTFLINTKTDHLFSSFVYAIIFVALIKIIFVLVSVAYFTIAERKVMASIQRRRGPDVVGFFGLLQPIADGLKLLAKNLLIPTTANKTIFLLAPVMILTLCFISWSLIFCFFESIQTAHCMEAPVNPKTPELSNNEPTQNDLEVKKSIKDYLPSKKTTYFIVGGVVIGFTVGVGVTCLVWNVSPLTLAQWAGGSVLKIVGLGTGAAAGIGPQTTTVGTQTSTEIPQLITQGTQVSQYVGRQRSQTLMHDRILEPISGGISQRPRSSSVIVPPQTQNIADTVREPENFEILMDRCSPMIQYMFKVLEEKFCATMASTENSFIISSSSEGKPEDLHMLFMYYQDYVRMIAADDELRLFRFKVAYGLFPNILEESYSFVSLLPYTLMFILALSSLSVYGIIISGWASNSKYAFLGSLRSAAQMISYEVSIGLVLLPIVLLSYNLSLSRIVLVQDQNGWFLFPLLLCAIIFFISMLAETNRTPFDLPEAEAELVAGYNVEYSAIVFAMFFLGEYSNMLFMSTLITLLFFGGWITSLFSQYGFICVLFLSFKITFFCFLFILVRATLPRYKYNQLMQIGWKIFLPISLSYLMLIATFIIINN